MCGAASDSTEHRYGAGSKVKYHWHIFPQLTPWNFSKFAHVFVPVDVATGTVHLSIPTETGASYVPSICIFAHCLGVVRKG